MLQAVTWANRGVRISTATVESAMDGLISAPIPRLFGAMLSVLGEQGTSRKLSARPINAAGATSGAQTDATVREMTTDQSW